MSVETRHIAIVVHLEGDAISGRAGDGTAQPTHFDGWLGLLQALDTLLRRYPNLPERPHLRYELAQHRPRGAGARSRSDEP